MPVEPTKVSATCCTKKDCKTPPDASVMCGKFKVATAFTAFTKGLWGKMRINGKWGIT